MTETNDVFIHAFSSCMSYFECSYCYAATCSRHRCHSTPCVMFNIVSFNCIETCRIIETSDSIQWTAETTNSDATTRKRTSFIISIVIDSIVPPCVHWWQRFPTVWWRIEYFSAIQMNIAIVTTDGIDTAIDSAHANMSSTSRHFRNIEPSIMP
jgi:hypothetical protein